MVGVEVLNEDESHARIGRQILDQLSKRLQAASGRADADYEKMLWNMTFERFSARLAGVFSLRDSYTRARMPPAIRFESLFPADCF